jgi:phospholipase/carboxylesterase
MKDFAENRLVRDDDASPRRMSRRRLIGLGVTGLAAAIATPLATACSLGAAPAGEPDYQPGDGRLAARPGIPNGTVSPGTMPLELASGRDGLLHVPASYRASQAAPLIVMLHGAGGAASRWSTRFIDMSEKHGIILLTPDSRGPTWDAIGRGFGPDVEFIDRALTFAFARCLVDPARVSVQGFSDGASYALSLGLTNGDLFKRIVAFSPGFVVPIKRQGKPRVFVSHGINDQILPIDQCSRTIVPQLRKAGYDVDYREFDGPHAVPPAIMDGAAEWLAAG